MDYEQIIEAQLDETNISELEDIVDDTSKEYSLLEVLELDDFSVSDIVDRALNGEAIFSTDNILNNLLELFLMEMKSSLYVGAQIIVICIVVGLLNNMSISFSSKVSVLGTMICSCVIMVLCIGNMYQCYEFCSSTMSIMVTTMEVCLPIMLPLLISMGSISTGSILNPVILGAVTGFNFIIQHIVLPLIFMATVFTLINSITEKDYVKKLAQLLRRCAVFITGLCITIFTGMTAIQGIMTKSADGILINTTRFSLSNFIPIVGGFAADSLDMVISCIGVIKNAVGIIGIIVIVSLLLTPVLKMLSIALIYKIIAVAIEPIASRNISDCLGDMGTLAVTMTVVISMGALMFLIFITILMAMGGGSLWT